MTESITPLIAVVEDEDHLAQGLLFNLQAEGYRTHHESDGDAALAYLLATKDPIAAIVLDCMLPGADGFTIVRALREAHHYTPVLMLTARSRPEDVLEGLEAGADDYLPKPFDLRELAARAQALARRVSPWVHPVIVLGNLEIDPARREVRRGGQTLPMRRRERSLLELLALNRGKAVSRQTIEAKLYVDDNDLRSNSIEVAVSQLRRWIDAPGQPSRIVTLRGEGYRLDQ